MNEERLTETFKSTLKAGLKNLRDFAPLNQVVTDLVRAALPGHRPAPSSVLRYLPRSASFAVPLPNGSKLSFWAEGDECVTNLVYWNGWDAHEPETCRLFFEWAKSARVVFDVGAHVGYYSLLAAHANPSAQVFAFEPLPVVNNRLRKNLKVNAVANVQVADVALGREAGEFNFYHVPEGIPSSSGLSFEFHSRPGVPLAITKVKVQTADEFIKLNRIACLDLVKMDTEETEIDVLYGMSGALAQHKPKIICEVLGSQNSEMETLLRGLGYKFYLLTPHGPSPRSQIAAEGSRDNYLFLAE